MKPDTVNKSILIIIFFFRLHHVLRLIRLYLRKIKKNTRNEITFINHLQVRLLTRDVDLEFSYGILLQIDNQRQNQISNLSPLWC